MKGRLIRSLTYRECLEQGCTEEEAIDYLKSAGPPKIEWVLELDDHKPLLRAREKVEGFVRSVRLPPYLPGYLTAEQFSLIEPDLIKYELGPGWLFEDNVRIVDCDVDGFRYMARRHP